MANQWFGYYYTDGNPQVKRYFEPLDINEAEQSPFVGAVYGPFYAINRDDALALLNNFHKGEG